MSSTAKAVTLVDKMLTKKYRTDCEPPLPAVTYISTSDVSVDLWFKVNAGLEGDEAKVEWYYPNGSLFQTWYSRAVYNGINCKYFGLYIPDIPKGSLEGIWTAKAYWNGVLLFSLPFGIGNTNSGGIQKPRIDDINPKTIPVGVDTAVTITGANIQQNFGARVRIDDNVFPIHPGTQTKFINSNKVEIVVKVKDLNARTTGFSLWIVNQDNDNQASNEFVGLTATSNNITKPRIDDINPKNIPIGIDSTITLTGTNFNERFGVRLRIDGQVFTIRPGAQTNFINPNKVEVVVKVKDPNARTTNFSMWVVNQDDDNQASNEFIGLVAQTINEPSDPNSQRWVYSIVQGYQDLEGFYIVLEKKLLYGTTYQYRISAITDRPCCGRSMPGLDYVSLAIVTREGIRIEDSSKQIEVNHSNSLDILSPNNPNWVRPPNPFPSQYAVIVKDVAAIASESAGTVLGFVDLINDLLTLNQSNQLGPSDHFRAKMEAENDYDTRRLFVGDLAKFPNTFNRSYGVRFTINIDEQVGQPEFLIIAKHELGLIVSAEIGLDRRALTNRNLR